MTKGEKRQLFSDISISCNSLDVRSVEQFYYGFVKYLVQAVKEKKSVAFPDFGTFRLASYSARMNVTPHGVRHWVDKSVNIRFCPIKGVRDYVNGRII